MTSNRVYDFQKDTLTPLVVMPMWVTRINTALSRRSPPNVGGHLSPILSLIFFDFRGAADGSKRGRELAGGVGEKARELAGGGVGERAKRMRRWIYGKYRRSISYRHQTGQAFFVSRPTFWHTIKKIKQRITCLESADVLRCSVLHMLNPQNRGAEKKRNRKGFSNRLM